MTLLIVTIGLSIAIMVLGIKVIALEQEVDRLRYNLENNKDRINIIDTILRDLKINYDYKLEHEVPDWLVAYVSTQLNTKLALTKTNTGETIKL